MQAVKWTYYGTDSTRTKAIASYGTKFAADNWMHKSMGIQLGLTESYRSELPSGTDGTGYWNVTIYGLGYEDASYDVEVTKDGISENVTPSEAVDTSALQALVDSVKKMNATDYTTASWKEVEGELAEAEEELAKSAHYESMVNEAYTHLKAAVDALEKVKKHHPIQRRRYQRQHRSRQIHLTRKTIQRKRIRVKRVYQNRQL